MIIDMNGIIYFLYRHEEINEIINRIYMYIVAIIFILYHLCTHIKDILK